jgi:hypothetical protein
MLNTYEVTDELLANREGYSVNAWGNLPTDGYMVGGVVPSLILAPEAAKYSRTDAWIDEHWTKLKASGDVFAGIWTDTETGLVYVDLSERYDDLYTALAVATARGELAIWDVASSKEVRTEIGA